MKKGYILIAVLVFVALFGAITNPSKADYVDWAKTQVNQESGIIVGFIGGAIFDNYTTQNNYGVFSVYKTAMGENEDITAVGLFGNFIWLGQSGSFK
ncbi:DUF4359 domain-containing protein [Bacillus sp. Marseille-P3661]|uniref:DUF4359 domain-containing protein n=1 Tax=Bacillus sp. Marseille-P3661 TaxID=1936234 RepID=UPI000C81BB07|nr:DUF4359 domain-containing protein [Bacillus sp. Marseille-P3661]